MDKNYIIETKNLTKQYGSQKSVADLNIHVQRGRIYGLLAVIVVISAVLIICMKETEPKQAKKKAKKVTPKKGW